MLTLLQQQRGVEITAFQQDIGSHGGAHLDRDNTRARRRFRIVIAGPGLDSRAGGNLENLTPEKKHWIPPQNTAGMAVGGMTNFGRVILFQQRDDFGGGLRRWNSTVSAGRLAGYIYFIHSPAATAHALAGIIRRLSGLGRTTLFLK